MGREIRMVPKGWEHPKNEKGQFVPKFDEFFKDAANEWITKLLLWQEGKHPDQIKSPEITKKYPYYWQWENNPPDEESYLEEFKSKPICFQIYETVTEGTPVSPVFETEEEMKRYIINKMGHSEKSADNFIKSKWAPTGVFISEKGYFGGIDAAGEMDKRED